MVDSVGAISTAMNASAVRASATVSASSSSESVAVVNTSVPLSPASKVDPMSGVVITEYINDSGEVTSQIPSSAAIAYMRVGLTASGTPVDKPNAALTA